jgi:PadR family transcriptional regulator, regulatory protein PadR
MRHGRFRGARYRHAGEPWRVRARVERFVEAAVLLLLRDRPAHGYELLERLGELLQPDGADMGNLYRLLRALEEDGLVKSHWDATVPGPAKRVYELTDAGRELLDEWAAGLDRAAKRISVFLKRYRKEVDDASA